MSISDKIVHKFTGNTIKPVAMTLEQMVELIKKYYILHASSDDEYNEIYKTIKSRFLKNGDLISQDGLYEMHCETNRRVSLVNLKSHNIIWIHEKNTDKYYKYSAWSFKKLRKHVHSEIAGIKAGI